MPALTRRHPSAILLIVQRTGLVLYPLLEATRGGALALGARALDRLKMFAGVMYLACVVSRLIGLTLRR